MKKRAVILIVVLHRVHDRFAALLLVLWGGCICTVVYLRRPMLSFSYSTKSNAEIRIRSVIGVTTQWKYSPSKLLLF